MSDDQEPIGSVQGDDWRDIAEAVRTQLKKRLTDLALMNPSELSSFLEALNKATEFERDCLVFDKHVSWRVGIYEKSWSG